MQVLSTAWLQYVREKSALQYILAFLAPDGGHGVRESPFCMRHQFVMYAFRSQRNNGYAR